MYNSVSAQIWRPFIPIWRPATSINGDMTLRSLLNSVASQLCPQLAGNWSYGAICRHPDMSEPHSETEKLTFHQKLHHFASFPRTTEQSRRKLFWRWMCSLHHDRILRQIQPFFSCHSLNYPTKPRLIWF